MKSVKKKLLFTSAMAVAACSCFALTACQNKQPPTTPEPFGAPENVQVANDLLTWGSVDGASNGYTVKINSDETTTVSVNELDLKTVTDKFTSGSNTLSVKVNAVGDKAESAYSQTVTYNYNPGGSSSTPFGKLTISLNGDTVNWAAADGATAGYTVKIGAGTLVVETNSVDLTSDKAVELLVRGDNDISVKVNAAGNHTESEYSNVVTYNYVISAADEAKSFITSVNAIGTVDASALSKIEVAKAKYNALSDEAKEVSGVSDAIATLKQKDGAYFALLVTDITAVTEDSALTAFQAFETKHAAALDYYGKLIDNTGNAASAKAALDSKKTEYDALVEEIEDGVDALVDDINALLEKDYSETEPTKADVTALDKAKDDIDALKPYAAKYFADEYSDKTSGIADKKAEILSIAVMSKTVKVQSPVVYNHQYQPTNESYMYVVRKFVNVLGDAITDITLPTVTATGATVTAPTAANAKGEYVWTLAFTTPDADTAAEFTYTVGSEEAIPVKIECTRNTSIYDVLLDGGKLTFARGDNAYMDIYDSSLVKKGTNSGEKDIIIDGTPVISGYKVTSEKLTEDSLKSLLARAGLRGEQSVTLVLYNKTEGVDGAVAYSATNETSTLTYSCTLTDDDALVRIPFVVVNGALEIRSDGSFICGSDFKTSNIAAVFDDEAVTEANVRSYLRYHVTIYKDGVKKGDFYASIPGDATLDAATIKRNVYKFCGETTADDNISLTVAITLAEDSEYADRLRESLTSPQKDWKYKGTGFTADAENARFTGGKLNNVAIAATEAKDGDIAYGDWEWANANSDKTYNEFFHAYHDGLALLVFDATGMDDADSYDFVANNVKPFAVYTHTTFNNMTWSKVNAEIDKAWAALPAAQKKNEMKFVFATQVIANEDGVAEGWLNSEAHYFLNNEDNSKHAVVTYQRDFSVPTNNQIQLDGIYFKPMNENETDRGEILYNEMFGVEYIEVKITINNNDYLAYIMMDDEYYTGFDGVQERHMLGMYIDTDKGGARLGLDYVSNGWCFYTDFVKFVNDNKAHFGLEGAGDGGEDLVFTADDAVEFRTKIVHDGTFFNNESDYSDPVGKNLPTD